MNKKDKIEQYIKITQNFININIFKFINLMIYRLLKIFLLSFKFYNN